MCKGIRPCRVVVLLMIVWVLCFVASIACAADTVPREAMQHRTNLTRNAHMIWGLDAPVATFAAQIHQESAWRANARSRAGAAGMSQFMPATARWIASVYPSLATMQPDNPVWAMRALLTYDLHLWQRIRAADDCQRMAMTLSAYNGGLGWIYRDQQLARAAPGKGPGKPIDATLWFDGIERLNAGRSPAAWRENRDYPRRILHGHQLRYIAAGFGQGVC